MNPWYESLMNHITELHNLPFGWHETDSVPVSSGASVTLLYALHVLYREGVPAPQIVPGSDGSVQLEWHFNGADLEIDINTDGSIDADISSESRGLISAYQGRDWDWARSTLRCIATVNDMETLLSGAENHAAMEAAEFRSLMQLPSNMKRPPDQ